MKKQYYMFLLEIGLFRARRYWVSERGGHLEHAIIIHLATIE